eukprot:gene1980-2160_t
MFRYDDEEDRPSAGNGSYKIPDRDYYRKNFSGFSSVHNFLSSHYDMREQQRAFPLPHFSSLADIVPPYGSLSNPSDGVCCHFLRRGFTKPTKVPFNCAVWSADSRWLVLGTQTGDLALWEGEGLKVYKVVSVPAHKEFYGDGDRIKEQIPITAMAWKRYGNLLVTGDNRGLIQYCDETFRNVFVTKDAHAQAVRGLSFAPLDTKLVSCSDDGKVHIWSIGRDRPDQVLQGHQSDVKAVEWHPHRGLIVSCSRDATLKLWDPKQSRCVSTISAHKKQVNCCSWNMNGNWLASGSTDGMVKIYDIRTMKEIEAWRGQNSEVCRIGWHPVHESLLLSGGYNGSLVFWLVGHGAAPHTVISDAHRQSIDLIAWHPAGHLLATASHDSMLKFWCREPPGSRLDPVCSEALQMDNPPVVHYGPLTSEAMRSITAKAAAQSAAQSALSAARASQAGGMTQSSNFGPSGRSGGGRKRPRDN